MKSILFHIILTLIIFCCKKNNFEREKKVFNGEVNSIDNCYFINTSIIDLGEDGKIDEYGIELKTGGISEFQSKAKEIRKTGDFSFELDSLLPECKYSFRYYTVDGDTTYGEWMLFETNVVSFLDSIDINITSSSKLNINIQNQQFCSYKVAEIGICYRTIADTSLICLSKNYNTNDASFLFSINNEEPEANYTLYPFIVFKNGEKLLGKDRTINIGKLNFETLNNAIVLNSVSNDVELQMNINLIGNDSISEIGFVYSSTSSNPDYNSNKVLLDNPTQLGLNTSLVSGLSNNTKYYFRAYSRIDNKILYGDVFTFVTN